MAGTLITLWTARDFDFSDLGDGDEALFDACSVTDMLSYRDALFLLRIHSVTITGSAVLDFSVHPAGPSPDDPAGRYVDLGTSVGLSVAGTASGELVRGLVPLSVFGAYVQVRGKAAQPMGSTETIQARVSAALVGRR
jgi:hypothetical protein